MIFYEPLGCDALRSAHNRLFGLDSIPAYRLELCDFILSFAADCLETLEEIAVENAHVFKRYGGENFVAIPCLNDSQAGMLILWQLAMRELKVWV